jgi:hypothetical protein
MMDGAFQKVLAYEGPGSYHELESHVEFGQKQCKTERDTENEGGVCLLLSRRRREETREKMWEVRGVEGSFWRWGRSRQGIVGIEGLWMIWCL